MPGTVPDPGNTAMNEIKSYPRGAYTLVGDKKEIIALYSIQRHNVNFRKWYML